MINYSLQNTAHLTLLAMIATLVQQGSCDVVVSLVSVSPSASECVSLSAGNALRPPLNMTYSSSLSHRGDGRIGDCIYIIHTTDIRWTTMQHETCLWSIKASSVVTWTFYVDMVLHCVHWLDENLSQNSSATAKEFPHLLTRWHVR